MYAVGFVAVVAVNARTCEAGDHGGCDHVWDSPVALMWPLGAAVVVGLAPVWVPLWLIGRVSHRVDARIVARREKGRA